jgi:hypothetical protein
MLFGTTSPRGSLSPMKTLELANVYLEQASTANDPDISLVLCHDTEVSLSQARQTLKKAKDQTLIDGITTAYIDLGKVLERRGHDTEAQESYKKAKKLG